jgi:cytidylate kinase
VSELAEHGAAVIVGRGANFLVKPEQALRVRVICPLAERVRRHAASALVSLPDAERLVQQKDHERLRFVRQLCDQDARDPHHYDVLVNTGGLSEQQAATLVVDAYRARFASAESARGQPTAQATP